MVRGTARRRAGAVAAVALVAATCGVVGVIPRALPSSGLTGIHKIRHVIVIMQENRSFDSYFGTFPGADGIPMANGVPTVCVPDPAVGHCVRPFHDPDVVNEGGPHSDTSARADVDAGAMDGFVRNAFAGRRAFCITAPVDDPRCTGIITHDRVPDVMGYHDAREIPNYWTYARDFVLQDHMFEPVESWSLPSHMWMVSGWSARCSNPIDPMSCRTALDFGSHRNPLLRGGYPWTDLTWLLHRDHVTWRYYVSQGQQPDCDDDGMFCRRGHQSAGTPGIWNPLPKFDDVNEDGQRGNIRPVGSFLRAARAGHLRERLVDRAEPARQRAPARVDPDRRGVRHAADRRRDGEPRLVVHRDLPGVGRLGRVLRPRRAAARGRRRLRPAGSGIADLAVRAAGGASTTRRCRSTGT